MPAFTRAGQNLRAVMHMHVASDKSVCWWQQRTSAEQVLSQPCLCEEDVLADDWIIFHELQLLRKLQTVLLADIEKACSSFAQ